MRKTHFWALILAATAQTLKTTCTKTTCCESIASAGLRDRLLFPGSAAYDARLASLFSPNARIESWCIVQPQTSAETATALQALLATECCTIGVRSGGHGIWAGANYVADGVTIDFGNMKTVSYDPSTRVASIQPGINWDSVYSSLEEHGVTVVGGRTPSVGVGGFLTGGGISFYSGQRGFGCDNVVNYEVVLADGSIINANRSSNADLWQALKGGHGNLGLITRFDMETLPSTNIWGGPHIYANAASDAAVQAFTEFTENSGSDPASSSMMVWTYMPQMKMNAILALLVNTAGAEDAPALQGLRNIQPLLSASPRLDTHGSVVRDFDFAPGYRGIWFTLTWANSAEMNAYMVSLYNPLVAEFQDALGIDADFITHWALSPISPAMVKNGARHGENVLGLERWATPGVFMCGSLSVRDSEANNIGRPILKRYVDMLEAKAKELGVFRDWLYINYADGSQDPFSGIGEDSLKKLRNAARKYDPKGVFQKRVVSGYKLPPTQDNVLALNDDTIRDEL